MKEETKSFCGLINSENQKIIDSWSSECEYGFAACGCAAPAQLRDTRAGRTGVDVCVPSAESTSESWPPPEHRPPGLCATQASTPVFPEGEPAYIIGETDIRRIVTAMDNCRWSDVFAVLEKQPWFKDVRRGIRATRHLKPTDYIKLSERPKDMTEHRPQACAPHRRGRLCSDAIHHTIMAPLNAMKRIVKLIPIE